MDPRDRDEDGRTFKVNFSGDGAGRLRERVKEKLKEFMGDYTDDTLVEYVVVLLRNGRHKDEARRELNVFLGDDSDSFVAWLWDHLSSNLHLYVQPKESFPDTTTKAKPILDELSGRHAPAEYVRGDLLTDSEYETEKLNKVSRTRRNREWKGLVQEEDASFPVRKSSMENIQTAEGTHEKPTIARRSSSPRPQIHKKRSRQDEQPLPKKRETVSMPVIDAPRRLLQFAVRDAVKTVQQSSAKAEPVSKRLRSVVSITFEDSALDERPQKMRSLRRVPGAVATALKAAAEAAEDVRRSRYSGSVFDRLGHASMTSEVANQASVFKETVPEDEENESFARFPHSSHSYFNEKNGNGGEFAGDLTMLDRETEIAADSTSDNVGYDNIGADRPGDFDISQTTSSVNRDKKSLMVQYSVAQDADKVVRKTSSVDQNLPTSAAAKGSSKIVNISVNVNTWKPPHYQETRDVMGARHQMTINKNEVVAAKPNAQFLNEKNSVHSVNESCYLTECNDLMRERTLKDVQKESQKTAASIPGSHTAGCPSEDIDSHTVFVSNVHFAATKDSLSRHFNKFGEVLKVIIAIDPATGQPTGSAYVEFLRKESAELALSLNGTSFMSRILKVVRRSSAHPEAAAMMGWPRIARSSPFVSRISRTPFARGILANSFRARLPVKPGPRSLQWKREASTETGPQKSLATSGNSVPTPTGRSFTYLRSESKA